MSVMQMAATGSFVGNIFLEQRGSLEAKIARQFGRGKIAMYQDKDAASNALSRRDTPAVIGYSVELRVFDP